MSEQSTTKALFVDMCLVTIVLGGDWNHGFLMDFHSVGNVMSSQLTFTPSFFRGVG